MNNTLRTILIAAAVFVLGAGLLFAGVAIGRSFWWGSNGFFGPGGMMGYSADGVDGPFSFGGGWMHGGGGMMGGWQGGRGGFGPGMGGYYDRDDTGARPYGYGGMHGGMMGGFGFSGGEDLPVLSIDEVTKTLEAYIEDLGYENLEVEEIMIFSNHAYAEIVETDTGIGAFEVLVDPLNGAVLPEPGPNMMWNLKYGMHGGGGMMGGFGYNRFGGASADAEMTVGPEEAVELAQAYLDAHYPGLQVDDHADTFYGYYTLHTLEDGQIAGMLSVNGYSGDVFPHTWHGDFIEMSQEDEH